MTTAQKEEVLIGGKTEAEIKAELAASAASAENQDATAGLEGALQKKDEKDFAEATGKDIPFDVTKFITEGVIAKTNVRVMDDLYVDMHTLSRKERVLSEMLVRSRLGENPRQDNVYNLTLDTATLAVAITRINNQPFANPDPYAAKAEQTEEFLGKVKLLGTLMDSSEGMTNLLSIIYLNLEAADALNKVQGDVPKK